MTTEGYCLPFREKKGSVISGNGGDTSPNNGQYNNLNLNQSNRHTLNQTLESTSKTVIKNDSKEISKYAISLPSDYKTTESQSIINNHSKIHEKSNKHNLLSNLDKNELKKEDSSKNSIHKSTLSLHIAAYENANPTSTTSPIKNDVNGGSSDNDINDGPKMKGENLIKKSNDEILGSSNKMDFPRQQNIVNLNEMEPEIAKFKTSQKLLNQNETISSPARTSVKWPHQQQQQRQRNFSTDCGTPKSHLLQHNNIRPRSNLVANNLHRQHYQPSHGIFSDTFVMKNVQNFDGSWNEGKKDIAEREHYGTPLSFPISMSCDVCKKRFGFTRNAFECRDCKLRFHRQCQGLAPLPCIPKASIPSSPAKQKQSILIDFCSSSHPYIPSLIIHCTLALEREHLDREGIYRISGTVSSVTKLLNDFLSSRVIPDLSSTPTENITGCIKKFFKELRDSVIPSTSYSTFMQAIEENNEQKIITSVFELPAPNRDTLAYLILHLQKVAEYSSKNKMPIENLARVLAPTLIGYSKRLQYNKIAEEYTINCNQTMILYRLLKLPAEFWSQFLESDICPFSLALEEEKEEATIKTTIIQSAASTSSSPSTTTAATLPLPPRSEAAPSTPKMPRSFSSRRTGSSTRNNNWNKREVKSEGRSPPPKQPSKTSPLLRSFSLASSLVRSFKSAF